MSSEKYAQTPDDRQKELEAQLRFLERSAKHFDEGDVEEAKRIALSIRLLAHDTDKSASLLGQLGFKKQAFADTTISDPALGHPEGSPKAPPPRDGRLVEGASYTHYSPYFGLVVCGLDSEAGLCFAPLDDGRPIKSVPFEEWWNAVVVDRRDGLTMTRKGLVTKMANTDGGAHVAPELQAGYADLARRGAVGLICGSMNGAALPSVGECFPVGLTMAPPSNLVHASVRQIAHEILKTFKPGYTAKRPAGQPNSGMAGPFYVSFTVTKNASGQNSEKKAANAKPRLPKKRKRLGRNDPCSCGSGEKYKECCGKGR